MDKLFSIIHKVFMFHYQLYEHGSLYGQRYIFPSVGDGIPMHDHSEEQRHNIMVMSGRLEVYGPNKEWCVELHAGDIFDLLDEHHPHEIAALEPNTISVGMFIHGKPLGENVPQEERIGTIFKPLTLSKVGTG